MGPPVEAPVSESPADGSLHAGRIWISPDEIDDEAGWGDEASDEEFDGEIAEAHGEPELDDVAPEYDEVRESEPELVPVAASVFDDDFFRSRDAAEAKEAAAVAASREPERIGVMESPEGARLFAGASASQAEHAETDELDIPAFLRKSR
jgi:cell division protein FtsZ